MMHRKVSLGVMVWVVVGTVVAARHDFLNRLDGLSGILSAVLAVVLWPLVVLKIHAGI